MPLPPSLALLRLRRFQFVFPGAPQGDAFEELGPNADYVDRAQVNILLRGSHTDKLEMATSVRDLTHYVRAFFTNTHDGEFSAAFATRPDLSDNELVALYQKEFAATRIALFTNPQAARASDLTYFVSDDLATFPRSAWRALRSFLQNTDDDWLLNAVAEYEDAPGFALRIVAGHSFTWDLTLHRLAAKPPLHMTARDQEAVSRLASEQLAERHAIPGFSAPPIELM